RLDRLPAYLVRWRWKADDQLPVAPPHRDRAVLGGDRAIELLQRGDLQRRCDNPEKAAIRRGEPAPDQHRPGVGDAVPDRLADKDAVIGGIAQMLEIGTVRQVEGGRRPAPRQVD